MSTCDPSTADRTDPLLTALNATLLQIRIRNTSCRLALALAQARGYAETWGHDTQAATWDANAAVLRHELEDLTAHQLAA